MIGSEERYRGWADTWIAPALVAGVAAAVFARALSAGFVWDDFATVVENELIQNPTSWLRVLHDPEGANRIGFVRPLRTLDFALDRALFGPGPLAFHVHSLLWHVAASVLLLLVLRRLLSDGRSMAAGRIRPSGGGSRALAAGRTRPSGGGSRAALLGALFWAVHPVQIESVAWIASRDVAMASWVFTALLFALRTKGADLDLAASLVAAAVAPFYKETAFALPIVIAALRWTKLARIPVWPYAVVAAAGLAYRFGTYAAAPNPLVLGGSVDGALATMLRGFGFYLAETLVPAQSTDWYMTPSTSLLDAAALGWLGVHAALVASAIAARRRAPLWTLAVSWFYAFLLPVSNMPGIYVGVPTAERYLCVSLAAVSVVLSSTLRRAPRAAWTAALLGTSALAAITIDRVGAWRDDETLWRSVLADHESPRARGYLGAELRDEALEKLPRIASMPPGPERDAATMAWVRLCEDALDQFHGSLRLTREFEMSPKTNNPVIPVSEFNASNMCWYLRRDEEALFHAEELLRFDHAHVPQSHYDRALALARLGFAPQAMESMRRSREIGGSSPSEEAGRFFRDAAADCEGKGLFAQARRGYEAAIEASPVGPLQVEARVRLAELRAKPRPADADARERERIVQLDAELARLPRSCPERRDVPTAKPDEGTVRLLGWLVAGAVMSAAGAGVWAASVRMRRRKADEQADHAPQRA